MTQEYKPSETTIGIVVIFAIGVVALLAVGVVALIQNPKVVTLASTADCPEDAILVWSGTTNAHTVCLTWDDISDAPYPGEPRVSAERQPTGIRNDCDARQVIVLWPRVGPDRQTCIDADLIDHVVRVIFWHPDKAWP